MSKSSSTHIAILFVILLSLALVEPRDRIDSEVKKRVGIIGAGVGGSFTAKYLADYDTDCILDVTIYDGSGIENDQGSRVSSVTLSDGTHVELGASIIFEGNRLVNEMIQGDAELKKIVPLSGGMNKNIRSGEQIPREGIGIYDGTNERKPWALLVSSKEDIQKSLLWRYNLDLYRIRKAANAVFESFLHIYDAIDSNIIFPESPNEIWRNLGLAYAASVSFDTYLDDLGILSRVSWWKNFLGDQGIVRKELYTAMNLCNNNQNNANITALAALVNSIASTGKLFAIEGGNDRLMSSAIHQAQVKLQGSCDAQDRSKIKQLSRRVKTVVSDFENGFELFDLDGMLLGVYDIVVLATPLQFSGIDFLVKGSMFDSTILNPMPLNAMKEHDEGDIRIHQNQITTRNYLPTSAMRSYVKVVTTFVIDGNINVTHFSLNEHDIPRSIYFTEEGTKTQNGVVSISQIVGSTYKIFSSKELSKEDVKVLLGEEAKIDFTKVWDKGATPSFDGGGEASYSTNFLLYDGGHGIGGFSSGSALYYVNAMESALSAVEIVAIGSKFVSKLIARKVGILKPSLHDFTGDEL